MVNMKVFLFLFNIASVASFTGINKVAFSPKLSTALKAVNGNGEDVNVNGLNGSSEDKKKVIVLGGDGFCGWPTSLYLSDQGHDVVIVDILVILTYVQMY